MINSYLSGYDVLQYYAINLAKNTFLYVKMPTIEKYYRAPEDYFLLEKGVNSAVESAWIIKMGLLPPNVEVAVVHITECQKNTI